MQVGPVCLSRIVYSLGSQLINNSLSCPSAGAGGDGLNFPGFFFLLAASPWQHSIPGAAAGAVQPAREDPHALPAPAGDPTAG